MSIGVHQRHCCVLHSCKYGDEDCPVVDGTVRQEFPCESCHDEGYKTLAEVPTWEQLQDCKKGKNPWRRLQCRRGVFYTAPADFALILLQDGTEVVLAQHESLYEMNKKIRLAEKLFGIVCEGHYELPCEEKP